MRRVIIDTREPWPHPWDEYLPEGFQFERGTLETGDIALAALPDGAVVERKTPGDMVGCIGSERQRCQWTTPIWHDIRKRQNHLFFQKDMFFAYMLGVLLLFIVVSSALAVTRAGAQAEIRARGFTNVGLVTHKIADGSATFVEKLMVVAMTAFGAFISPLWLISSGTIGGILYAIFDVWLGWT